jgi:hypothetical protein
MEFPDRIKVDVTQANLDEGDARDCNNCPVAMAAAPLFPGYVVTVDYSKIQVWQIVEVGRPLAAYRLPWWAQQRIRQFDRGQLLPFTPFHFHADRIPEDLSAPVTLNLEG